MTRSLVHRNRRRTARTLAFAGVTGVLGLAGGVAAPIAGAAAPASAADPVAAGAPTFAPGTAPSGARVQATEDRVPLRLGEAPTRPTLVPEVDRSGDSTAGTGTAASRLSPSPVSTWRITYTANFPTEARAALQRAVDIWARAVPSTVPINVAATWTDLGDPGLLAQAGPASVVSYNKGVLYPIALAEAMDEQELNPGEADIAVEFNSSQPSWHYGATAPDGSKVDFSTVALHELGHGVGFLGSMNKDGTTGSYGSDVDVYDLSTASAAPQNGPLLDYPSPSTTLGTALTSGTLTWIGPAGRSAADGTRPVLFAPSMWQPGSSYAHLDEATYPAGHPDSLMTPRIGRGEAIRDPGDIALGMLEDMGFRTPVDALYRRLGGSASFLGQPTAPERAAAAGEGRMRTYQGGAIYWSPASGAAEVHGSIRQTWERLGAERGALSYPRTNERGTPDGSGRFNHFLGGSVYFSARTGAHEVRGTIERTWAALGYERSAVGYPVSDETAVGDGRGRVNRFERGSISWSPTTGASEVRGSIEAAWLALGGQRSALGYPLSNELGTPDGRGRFNRFEAGSVYFSPGTGAHEVRGAIFQTWSRLGSEKGPLGYPVSNERGTPDGRGRYSSFQSGAVYWSPSTGAHEVRGSIGDAWLGQGAERGSLGYPVSDEYAVSGGRAEDFQGGRLTWSASTGRVTRTAR